RYFRNIGDLLAVDGDLSGAVIADQGTFVAFEEGAYPAGSRSRHVGCRGGPVYIKSVEFIIYVYPFGCISNAGGGLSFGADVFEAFGLYRPEHDISDMAPEIGEHPPGIIQEVAVGEMAFCRDIVGIRGRAEPHIPVE